MPVLDRAQYTLCAALNRRANDAGVIVLGCAEVPAFRPQRLTRLTPD